MDWEIDAVGFDGDDTLWHTMPGYNDARETFYHLLEPALARDRAEAFLDTLHSKRLPLHGFGARTLTLTMIEAAVQAAPELVDAQLIERLLQTGRELLRLPVRLIDGVVEVLERTSSRHPLLLITKGDLLDQQRKVSESGLARYFAGVEIVSQKTAQSYRAALARHGVDPRRFLMVGDSARSDVLPVLELGGAAVHVPYSVTWREEEAALPDVGRYAVLKRIDQLPAWIERTGRTRAIP